EVSFDSSKSTLKQTAQNQLSKVVAILQTENGPYKIDVLGYTDSVGGREKNLSLSKARAQTVADFLVSSGLASNRLNRTEGRADESPIATNDTEAGRRENRRVEIVITGIEKG